MDNKTGLEAVPVFDFLEGRRVRVQLHHRAALSVDSYVDTTPRGQVGEDSRERSGRRRRTPSLSPLSCYCFYCRWGQSREQLWSIPQGKCAREIATSNRSLAGVE